MKLTPKQQTELLSSLLNEDVEVVENETDSDFDRGVAVDKIGASLMPTLKSQYEKEWREEFEPKIAGKVGGTLERMLIRETSIDGKLLKGKSDEEKIKIALEYKMGQLDKDKSEWQEELKRVGDEKQALIDQYEAKVKEVENDWRGKYNQKEINNFYRSQLDKAPLNPKTDKEIASRDFTQYMATKYNLSFNEAANMVEYFQKDKPELPAQSKSASGKIEIMSEMEEYFKPRGLWETNTSNLPMPQGGENYTPSGAGSGNGKASPEALKEKRQAAYQSAGLTTQ